MEYDCERKAFKEISGRLGVERLAARGDAWPEVRVGNSYYNSLNRKVVELTRAGGDGSADGDDHHFEYGKSVALFSEGNPGKGGGWRILATGTVSYVDGDRMVVAVADSTDIEALRAVGSLGVMLSFDETSYRVMFEAIDRVARAEGRLGILRDLFYTDQPAGQLTAAPLAFPYLNPSQQKAVNMVLTAKDVAIVHGPPGTGKTTTLVEAINETLRRESQVLVCAQSNMAVDWICEQLVDRGIHVLRIGNPSRVNDKMLGFTYERRFEAHPLYPELWGIRKAVRELQARRHKGEGVHQKIDRLRDRGAQLEIAISSDLFNSAHVVASTLVSSASPVLNGKRFSTVFIDEAAQALEAACWAAISKAGRVVLAGDHCQLPPTVKSVEAMRGGLGRSLMERLVENHPETVSLLTVQYRMNAEIMDFSSRWFYGGMMTAAPEVAHRGILDFDRPLEWIDTSLYARELDLSEPEEEAGGAFRETVAGDSYGRVNRDEAALTLLTLQKFISKVGKERFLSERIDVGVISPYRAQTRFLRKMLGRLSFFKPFRHAITVDTVDGFQGRERDVIVVSLVRSNDRGDIGFLRDLRRMNVAITRARMKLIVIGDAPTLTRHPFYRRFHQSATKNVD